MNLERDSPEMSSFIESHSFFNHMKQKTCWKPSRRSCIDLILSNNKHSFNFYIVIKMAQNEVFSRNTQDEQK